MSNEILETVTSIIASFKNDIIKQIILEELLYLDYLERDNWAISISGNDKLRIHFGPFIIFTIEQQRIWLSLANAEYHNNINLINNIKAWTRDTDDFPKYKKYGLFSQNGYISNEISTGRNEWKIFKEIHFKFLKKICKGDYKLNSRTRENHSLELNLYLKAIISDEIPISSYVIRNDLTEEKIKNTYNQRQSEIQTPSYEKTETVSDAPARLGQQVFRKNLILKYGQSCMLCGIENTLLLKASHIKPWIESNNIERLNHSNGLLLCASHDALFDSGLISFNEDGSLLISDQLSKEDRKKLDLSKNKIEFDRETKDYIKWHRDNIFRKTQLKLELT
jgi:5-methylcytosine-specific restriction protein A